LKNYPSPFPRRLKTPEGKALYKQRKQTVEPVFGIIKEVLGFRRFSMRGKKKAKTEWLVGPETNPRLK